MITGFLSFQCLQVFYDARLSVSEAGTEALFLTVEYHTFQPIMTGDQMLKFLPDNESEESCASEHS